MTAREMWVYALIECNKLEAPSLLLEDYNYFINKAVQQYINKVYNRYDINQQSSDDIRVLKSNAICTLTQDNGSDKLFQNVWKTSLPENYLHILNCVIEYQVKKDFKCYTKDELVHFAAKRLTADSYAGILNNYYMRPEYKRPYFYIENRESYNLDTLIQNASTADNENFVDSEKGVKSRLSNPTPIIMEVRCGKSSDIFEPQKAYIDYIKSPMYIRLTQSQIDTEEDTSQVLEFPDYVCFEIVNEFVKLLLENASDPRLQTHFAVNQTVADPLQMQREAQAQAAAQRKS